MVLASSAATAKLDHYLDLLNARDLVDTKVSGDNVKQTKPTPDIRNSLAQIAGYQRRQMIVVGIHLMTSRLP